jgi:hypothetical protein
LCCGCRDPWGHTLSAAIPAQSSRAARVRGLVLIGQAIERRDADRFPAVSSRPTLSGMCPRCGRSVGGVGMGRPRRWC